MKNIITGVVVVAAALGALAFFNLTPFRTIVQDVITGSPSGSTFTSNSPDNGVIMTPTTNVTATSSITNNSGSDLGITQYNVTCENVGSSNTLNTGAGLVALKLTISTTTVPTAGVAAFSQIAQITIATSSPVFTLATTSLLVATTSMNTIWSAGNALVFSFNATNTANCHVGVTTVSL